MLQDPALISLISQYKQLVTCEQKCRLPELYGVKHSDLTSAAESGDLIALRSIAITLLKGDGVLKDVGNSREVFFRLSYGAGRDRDLISRYYFSKALCLQNDCPAGIGINDELLDEGFSPAFAFRGNLHQFGSCGLEKSFEKARLFYVKAYQQNHIPGTFLLAKLMFKNFGPVGMLKSFPIFLKAIWLSISPPDRGVGSEHDTY